MPKYLIADLVVEIEAPAGILHDNLACFETQKEDVDIHCHIVFKKQPKLPKETTGIIIKLPGTFIFDHQGYIHTFHDAGDIPSYTQISKDWSSYTMFIDPAINDPTDPRDLPGIKEGIFIKLREFIITALAQNEGLIIHSSTILFNDEGVMFSAPSGAGKTTHTNMWRSTYGTPILNGDSSACRIVHGYPRVYGIPWCGTSGQYINKSVNLRAIVFLQKAKYNKITKLEFREAFMRLSARCFLLPLNEILMNQYLDAVELVVQNSKCYSLDCLPNQDAVELVKNCLENQ